MYMSEQEAVIIANADIDPEFLNADARVMLFKHAGMPVEVCKYLAQHEDVFMLYAAYVNIIAGYERDLHWFKDEEDYRKYATRVYYTVEEFEHDPNKVVIRPSDIDLWTGIICRTY